MLRLWQTSSLWSCRGGREGYQNPNGHYHKRLVDFLEASVGGNTTIQLGAQLNILLLVDGLILSPTAHDHSLNYRSATLHLYQPTILDSLVPEQHEEKRCSLAEVTNVVTGYDRTTYVGNPVDPNLTSTTVVRCKIRSVSCKQRYGGFDSCKEPELRDEDTQSQGERAFQGVVPCWTEWGRPLGFGNDKAKVEKHFDDWRQENRTFAERSAWGSEDVKLEGTGKKRK